MDTNEGYMTAISKELLANPDDAAAKLKACDILWQEGALSRYKDKNISKVLRNTIDKALHYAKSCTPTAAIQDYGTAEHYADRIEARAQTDYEIAVIDHDEFKAVKHDLGHLLDLSAEAIALEILKGCDCKKGV